MLYTSEVANTETIQPSARYGHVPTQFMVPFVPPTSIAFLYFLFLLQNNVTNRKPESKKH